MSEPEKKWYEFTIGIYVEAGSEDEAWLKIQDELQALNKLDAEEELSVELVGEYHVGGASINGPSD